MQVLKSATAGRRRHVDSSRVHKLSGLGSPVGGSTTPVSAVTAQVAVFAERANATANHGSATGSEAQALTLTTEELQAAVAAPFCLHLRSHGDAKAGSKGQQTNAGPDVCAEAGLSVSCSKDSVPSPPRRMRRDVQAGFKTLQTGSGHPVQEDEGVLGGGVLQIVVTLSPGAVNALCHQ